MGVRCNGEVGHTYDHYAHTDRFEVTRWKDPYKKPAGSKFDETVDSIVRVASDKVFDWATSSGFHIADVGDAVARRLSQNMETVREEVAKQDYEDDKKSRNGDPESA